MVAANFSVDLSNYFGPLDLLLYLVRRQELDITSLSLSKITRQYFDFLTILESIDVDSTADFLEPAGVLLEIKAREVIPSTQEVDTEPESIVEPPDQLVHRLVQYKRIRDVASILDEQSRAWQNRFTRLAADRTPRRDAPVERSISKIEIWDLVSAFGRILRERQPTPPSQVVHDETPIHVYMEAIHQEIVQHKRVELQSLFKPGQHKSTLVAMFLATLELTRHHGVEAKQDGCDGPMWLSAGAAFHESLNVVAVENLRTDQIEQSNLPMRPR